MAKTAKATPAPKKRAPNGTTPVAAAKPDKKKKEAAAVVAVAPVREKLSDEPPKMAVAALTDAPPDAEKKAKKDKKDKKKKKNKDSAAEAAAGGGELKIKRDKNREKIERDLESLGKGGLGKKEAAKQLDRLQIELVKLQEWVKAKGLKVVIIFEGRDAAGKGGAIKRITEELNPRVCKVVALGTPTEREKSQWYFQRYAQYLPAAGEIVLFDRSWYNRSGVERVMGFCTEDEYREFLRSCPEFERMLIRSGIILIKYWFSVSPEEQERRFQARLNDVTKRWKFSPIDLKSRAMWHEYSRAKDEMFSFTDTKQSPWYVIDSDNKNIAYLNMIHHLLTLIPYEEIVPPKIELPTIQETGYLRPPVDYQTFIPKVYGV